MKAQVIKLEAYKGEQVMLIAPEEIMRNFISHLACAIYEGVDNATKDGRVFTAKHYLDIISQMKEQLNDEED